MRDRTWVGVGAAGIVLVGLYFLMPGATAHDLYYTALGLTAVAGMVAGLWLNRPRPLTPFVLLTAGIALMVAGDAVWEWYEIVLRTEAPYPSAADLAYLLAYPALFGGTALLARHAKDRRGVALEAWIIAVGVAALTWQFLMAPALRDTSGSVLANLVTGAYPAVDILLVAIITRLLLLGLWRNTALLLAGIGFACGLVADSLYGVQALSDTYVTGVWYDAGWLLEYTLLALAVAHPSVRSVASAVQSSKPVDIRFRLVALGVAGLIAPAVLAVSHRSGPNVLVITGIWALLFLLVLTRMRGLINALDSVLAQMRHRAHHDALTGLENRASFTERLEAAMKAPDPAFAVCYLDLDGFKNVNDTVGHAGGDALLVTVADRMRGATRAGDAVARLGGDEFAVYCPDVGTDAQAVLLGDRLAAAMKEPFSVDGEVFPVGASIGVALARPGEMFDELVARADAAMYRAKRLRSRGEASQAAARVSR